MARIIGNPYGELRGKVGGTVFSRNAGGAYLKVHAKPTNPKSQAQIRARAVFRNAGKGFATLTSDQQAQWNSFCKTVYNPFKKKNVGQFTGAMAYTALKTAIQNANELMCTSTISAFGGATTFPSITFDMLSQNIDAPVASVSPEIKDTGGANASMEVIAVALDASQICSIDVAFRGLQGAKLGQGQFIDGNNLNYGFSAFMSSPVKFEGSRPKEQYHANLGFTGIMTFGGADLSTCDGVRITFNASDAIARYKGQPSTDQYFMISLIVQAQNGTQTQLGSKFCKYGTSAGPIPS